MIKFWQKKLHASWFICWFFTGLLVGIAISGVKPVIVYALPWLIVSGCILILCLINRRAYVVIGIVIAGLIIGHTRGASEQTTLTDYENYYGQKIVLSGKIDDDPVVSAKPDTKLKLSNIKINSKDLSGEVWISVGQATTLNRGDLVLVGGKFNPGFGKFSGSIYNAEIIKVIDSGKSNYAKEFRDWFAAKIRVAIKEPEASLGIGFLVGQKSTLPDSLVKNLQILGLTHIVVASGYNLTILVRLARRLMHRVSKYMATISALSLTVFFMAMTGFSPSMNRAGLITFLSLIAWYYGRKINSFVLLGFSAGITAFINPAYVWGDVGWYLSFLAFGGVIILSPLLINYFFGEKKPNTILQIMSETFSAQIMTLPILAFAFGQIALLALPANLLVLPLIPYTMGLTFFAGVVSAVLPSLATIAGWPAQAILSYMTKVSDSLSSLPDAQKEVVISAVSIGLYYGFVILLIIYLKFRTKMELDTYNIVE